MKRKCQFLLIFFIAGIFDLLVQSCRPQPPSTITLNLSIPNNGTLSSTKEGFQSTDVKAISYTSYTPIQIYLKIVDDTGTVVFPNKDNPTGVIPLGNVAAGNYTATPNLTISNVNGRATSLTVTGHYIAKGLQAGGSVCSSGRGSSSSSSSSESDVFFADFTATPVKLSITADENQTLNITPILKQALFDKFALTIYNTDGTTRAAANYTPSLTYDSTTGYLTSTTFAPTSGTAPLLTVVSLLDPDSNTEIIDPCTGQSFNGRTDTSGRLNTDLPLKLSSTYSLKLRVTQFSVTSNIAYSPATLNALAATAASAQNTTSSTLNTYDLVSNATPITGCGTTTTMPNNADSIPIFWDLTLGGSTAVPKQGNGNYLNAAEALNGTISICGRIALNFNPRYADIPSVSQYYLQPFNPFPIGAPVAITTVSPATFSFTATSDIQLVHSQAFILLENPNSAAAANISHKIDSSIVKNQSLIIQCALFYNNGGLATAVGGFGVVGGTFSVPTITSYSDCTQFGKSYGITSGLAKFLSTTTPFEIRAYYTDSEGFLLAASNTVLTGGVQPSSTNPLQIRFQ